MNQYLKFFSAAALAIVSVIVAQFNDGKITAAEWVVIATATANAVNTYLVPNLPGAVSSVLKLLVVAVGAVTAGLTAQVISGGLSQTEIVTLALLAVQALLVYLAPNTQPSPAAFQR
jgi:hypothetical protein